jgi:hypothetical protein
MKEMWFFCLFSDRGKFEVKPLGIIVLHSKKQQI